MDFQYFLDNLKFGGQLSLKLSNANKIKLGVCIQDIKKKLNILKVEDMGYWNEYDKFLYFGILSFFHPGENYKNPFSFLLQLSLKYVLYTGLAEFIFLIGTSIALIVIAGPHNSYVPFTAAATARPRYFV